MFKRKNLLIFLIPLIVLSTLFFIGKNINLNKESNNNLSQKQELTNPYIIENGFTINGSNISDTSVIFTLTIVGEWDISNNIEITLLDSNNNHIEKTANRLSDSTHVIDEEINEIQYTYQVTGLNQSESYTFYSLNNTNLATENNGNIIDNEILIVDELNIDNSLISFDFKENDNPYIVDNSFKMEKTSYSEAIFSFETSSNWAIKDNLVISINIYREDTLPYAEHHNATLINEENMGNDYIKFTYEFSYDFSNQQISYIRIAELNNVYLSISNSENSIYQSIDLINDANYSYEELNFYNDSPYIVDGSFKILENSITINSMQFSLKIINNKHQDFKKEEDIDLTLKSDNEAINKSAHYVSDGSEENTYIYEIDNLNPNTNYSIEKINNEWLATSSNTNNIDNEILIEDDLNSNGDFKTLEDNPYISEINGFSILNTTINSVQFQINVTENQANSFDPNKDINVTLKDENGNSENVNASYLSSNNEENSYIYEITGLNVNTEYQIYSLNNTGLAVGINTNGIDNEILIEDDLNSNGDFKTLEDNPYISEINGFSILNTTINSVQFQINVIENQENSFDPNKDINVTLKDENGNSENVNASYLSSNNEENSYIYEITGLNIGTNYQIYSLNNTGLAVGINTNGIDNEILIEDDLNSNGDFKTLDGNPYINEGDFKITSFSDTTVTYTIVVENWENPKQEIEVNLMENNNNLALGETKTYTSYLIKEENNEYTYEVRGLNDETSYTFYSLIDSGLAINGATNEIDNEIILTEDLNIDSTTLSFITNKTKIPLWIILLIVILIILILIVAIFFLIRYLIKERNKKDEKEIQNLLKKI